MAFAAAVAISVSGRARASTWTIDRVRFAPVLPPGPPPPGNPANWLTSDSIGSYRGALNVTRDGPNVAVIDDVGFQDYLLGLSEMPRTWPLPALEAQVVAARTYALWHVLAAPPSPWKNAGAQICASDSCQVYRGLGAEQAKGSNQWATAVAATADQVLLWHRLVVFPAYGSRDGGQTVSGGVPWLPAVADPDDATSPLHHWQWSAPLQALEATLGITAPDHLTALVTQNGQVVATVTHADGSTTNTAFDPAAFYQTLNKTFPAPAGLPRPLPSRRFSVSSSSGQVAFDGSGFGNLVGLSQYGALGKALKGMAAPDILASYYGGLRPVVLPATQMPASILVEIGSGRPQLKVWAPGPLRVLDASGKVLAVTTGGAWTVTADRGGALRVEPGGAVVEPAKLPDPPAAFETPIPAAPAPTAPSPPALPPAQPAVVDPLQPAIKPIAQAASPTLLLVGAAALFVLTAGGVTAAAWRRLRGSPFPIRMLGR